MSNTFMNKTDLEQINKQELSKYNLIKFKGIMKEEKLPIIDKKKLFEIFIRDESDIFREFDL